MPLTVQCVRGELLKIGTRKLREFGYPACSPTNILTDEVYSRLFSGMLEETRGDRRSSLTIRTACQELLDIINARTPETRAVEG